MDICDADINALCIFQQGCGVNDMQRGTALRPEVNSSITTCTRDSGGSRVSDRGMCNSHFNTIYVFKKGHIIGMIGSSHTCMNIATQCIEVQPSYISSAPAFI